MPTGYTAELAEGRQTFEQFALGNISYHETSQANSPRMTSRLPASDSRHYLSET